MRDHDKAEKRYMESLGFSGGPMTAEQREVVDQHWDDIADQLGDDSYRTRGI